MLEKRRPKTCDHFFCYVPPKKLCELHPLRCNFLIFFFASVTRNKKSFIIYSPAQNSTENKHPQDPSSEMNFKRYHGRDKNEAQRLVFVPFFFFFLETSSNFANSMDSGLEAFSHNPTDGSVTPHWLFSQAYTPNIWTSGSSRTRLDYWGDETSSSSFFHFST